MRAGKWFDEIAKWLQEKGYESALTGAGQFVVFGPEKPDAETEGRIKSAVPEGTEVLVQVGPLHSTVAALDQQFQGHCQIALKPGRRLVITLDPRMTEAIDEYKLVNAVDEVMAKDKYPDRYDVIIGDHTIVRSPKLAADFADHAKFENRFSEVDVKIALETCATVEEFLKVA